MALLKAASVNIPAILSALNPSIFVLWRLLIDDTRDIRWVGFLAFMLSLSYVCIRNTPGPCFCPIARNLNKDLNCKTRSVSSVFGLDECMSSVRV